MIERDKTGNGQDEEYLGGRSQRIVALVERAPDGSVGTVFSIHRNNAEEDREELLAPELERKTNLAASGERNGLGRVLTVVPVVYELFVESFSDAVQAIQTGEAIPSGIWQQSTEAASVGFVPKTTNAGS